MVHSSPISASTGGAEQRHRTTCHRLSAAGRLVRRQGAQVPIDPFPRPAVGRDRLREHDAGNGPQLRAAWVAGHAGDEMGDPKPGGDESRGPESDSARQPTRAQRAGDHEEAGPGDRADCSGRATHRCFAGCTTTSIEGADWRLGFSGRDRAALALRDGTCGIGWRIGHACSFRRKSARRRVYHLK
jgi:hypothetical protein